MEKNFDNFMSNLKEVQFTLENYVDFPKVQNHVEAIAIKLNQLNYLIGQDDMTKAVELLWKENPKVFSVLSILIAVRPEAGKKALDMNDGQIRTITDYFNSPSGVVAFLNQTGLTEVLRSKQIKNLVDYVFGVEVGLDTHARKNRSGSIMHSLVGNVLRNNGIDYIPEVTSEKFPKVQEALGKDKKRFDFVVRTENTTYLIETNFYASQGSKPSEITRAYIGLAQRINSVPGYEFVWITDGNGWHDARNELNEAYNNIPHLYNLNDLGIFIDIVNSQNRQQLLDFNA